MINQELLNDATLKFRTSNDDMKLGGGGYIQDFITECYVRYDPSKRGNTLQKFILNELRDETFGVPATWDCGDFSIGQEKYLYYNNRLREITNYLNLCINSSKVKDRKVLIKLKSEINQRTFKALSTFCEIKTSYLSSDGYYTIGNIRTYQNYQYLVLLLVDCEDSFKDKIIVIPTSELKNIKMSHMHGTKKSNDDTKNPHLSFSIKKGSKFEMDLNQWRFYFGFDELRKFCKELSRKVFHKIKTINREQYDYIINDEVKLFFKERGDENVLIYPELDVLPHIYKLFRNLKKESFNRGESYWYDDKDKYKSIFEYENRAFIIDGDVYYNLMDKFNLTELEMNSCFSMYFDKRYPNLKHWMILKTYNRR